MITAILVFVIEIKKEASESFLVNHVSGDFCTTRTPLHYVYYRINTIRFNPHSTIIYRSDLYVHKFGAFIIGFYAGRGVVLLYQHPTFEFWKEIPFFSIKFALAVAFALSVLWLAVLSILLLRFLAKVGWKSPNE